MNEERSFAVEKRLFNDQTRFLTKNHVVRIDTRCRGIENYASSLG